MTESTSSTLRMLCEKKTKLTSADISLLELINQQLPLMADLTAGDVFIDCMESDGKTILVLAQKSPQWGLSSYRTDTVGMNVLRINEPAVYHSFESGVPVRDLKAITPENKAVRQNVLPVRNESGKTIAVLVCEVDISKSLQQERKYDELEQEQNGMNSLFKRSDIESETINTMREIHHMVKNNLQMVASILGIQSRKSANAETKKALQETISRVLSISSVHEMLLTTIDGENISLMQLLKKVRLNALSLVEDDKEIEITISGDSVYVNAAKATGIAQVTNELVINSLQHAFIGRQNGKVDVLVKSGTLYSTITVKDNGTGFDFFNWNRDSMGLSLATVTIRDKLKGELRFKSDSNGTQAMFDFKM